MQRYNFKDIESYWQNYWFKNRSFKTSPNKKKHFSSKKKPSNTSDKQK